MGVFGHSIMNLCTKALEETNILLRPKKGGGRAGGKGRVTL